MRALVPFKRTTEHDRFLSTGFPSANCTREGTRLSVDTATRRQAGRQTAGQWPAVRRWLFLVYYSSLSDALRRLRAM